MTTGVKTVADRMLATHPSYSFATAMLWESFVDRVIDLLARLEAKLRDAAVWQNFSLREGWWLDSLRMSAAGVSVRLPSEDAITHALEEIAKAILIDTRPADPLTDHLGFDAQVVRPPHGRIGRKALTTDIRVKSTLVDDLEVRIEAKLLFSPGDIVGAYLGPKGLLRFADPKAPYTDRPIGFMLGYSLQDHAPDWTHLTRVGLKAVDKVSAIDRIAAGSKEHLVSDLSWGGEERQKVSVIHIHMNYETDPSCRASAGL